MKTAVAIRHIEMEGLGVLDAVFEHWDFAFCYAEAGQEDLADAVSPEPDLLVILGGSMGVYETGKFPFLKDELSIIRARLASGKPMLGICLGAQLIAHAAGAKVYPATPEVGYHPITLTAAGEASGLSHLAGSQFNVLHWHGDTFDLPPGAELLCSSATTRNQGFAIGRNVLGLQFHVEVTPKDLEGWLANGLDALAMSAGADVAKLRADAARVGADVAVMGARAIDAWLSQLDWPEKQA